MVLPRDRTKTCPCEFTATPVTSPRYRSLGSLSGSVPSNGICGTASCAKTGDASSIRPKSRRFMAFLLDRVLRRGAPGTSLATGEYNGRHERSGGELD